MIRIGHLLLVFFVFLSSLGIAFAQFHHDPLNDHEIDQLRDAAQEPAKRMKLYVGFAKARMEMIQQMRTTPALMGENDSELRARLKDLATLVDEIDDNLDEFNDKTADLRKPLKSVIEMDSDFQVKLTELQRTSTPQQLQNYGLDLEDAMDSVKESADSARAMLDDQVAKRGKPKEDKKEDKEDDKPGKGHDADEVKPPCSPC